MDSESSMNSENSTLSTIKMFTLRQLAMNGLAKRVWISVEPLLPSTDDEITVSDYRALALRFKHSKRSTEKNLLGLPVIFKSELHEALVMLNKGFRDALRWERQQDTGLPFTVMSPIDSGTYWAGHFINPNGKFDHMAWVKQFVADENHAVLWRFKMAREYSMEDDQIRLWNSIGFNIDVEDEHDSSLFHNMSYFLGKEFRKTDAKKLAMK